MLRAKVQSIFHSRHILQNTLNNKGMNEYLFECREMIYFLDAIFKRRKEMDK